MYIVYHIKSTDEVKRFETEAGAKRSVTALNKKSIKRYGAAEYACATLDHYHKSVVKMVERTNLLSGEKFWEPSNTPNYCSPASESYWSM